VAGLDLSTGTELWRQQVGNQAVVFKPATDGELAFMVVPFGEIIAIDAETGEIAWRTGPTQSSAAGRFFQPSVDSNYVYASSSSGFFALSKE
jgi:outer membrane protein assembly factor BamB